MYRIIYHKLSTTMEETLKCLADENALGLDCLLTIAF